MSSPDVKMTWWVMTLFLLPLSIVAKLEFTVLLSDVAALY
jgi:hypothetical protein